jgi:hypothetical protein
MDSDAASRRKRACLHLLESKDGAYYQRFTGNGMEYNLVCSKCKAMPADIELHLLDVDFIRFKEIEQAGYWDGIIGQPEIRRRVSNLQFEHEAVSVPTLNPLHVLDIQPVPSEPDVWLGLSSDGALFRLDLSAQTMGELFRLPESHLDLQEKTMLRVSQSGDLIAVVNTKGQHGLVLDGTSGRSTLLLDRGNYHEDVSTFPLAFVEWERRTVLIHGTSWNRLDLSDAKTGELLTERSPTSYEQGEERPQHYLDYFHCGLTVSPGQQFVVDTGWVWHPMGVVAVWSLSRWFQENVWESEDGPSKKYLDSRGYHWDGPVCWLDDQHLAVWGYGDDDEWLIPALCIFDVVTGRQVRWFPGPKGTIAFDEHLFSWDEEGMVVWDSFTGEQFHTDKTLNPVSYHRGSKSFITLHDNTVQVSRLEPCLH